jgi:AcrR family transcriptional regulator/predicted DNA-binding transcriptional regulator AlpA
MVRMLRISELERLSGLSRSTIYHYQREGLLPAMHRSGGSPAVYGEQHLDALVHIRQMRADGRSLGEIRKSLASSAGSAVGEDVDLVARQREATRQQILAIAAREFAARGYRGCRLGDIIVATGISPQTFRRYFRDKRDLFVEVVDNLVSSAIQFAERRIVMEHDFVKRHLARARGFLRLRDISPEMLTFVRAESLGADDETRALFKRTYRELAQHIIDELEILRESSSHPPHSSDEMLGYGLLGVFEDAAMRVTWDGCYSVEDYLLTNLEMVLAVKALYLGPFDLARERERYLPYVHHLVEHHPFILGTHE